jgi:hypothetical protein
VVQPSRLWPAARIGENDDISARHTNTGIALVRYCNTDSGLRPELLPAHGSLMTPPDKIQSTFGRINDNYFAGPVDSPALGCDVHEGVIDARFIFAYYDN